MNSDIAIVGGGLVGASLAAALNKAPYRLSLVEASATTAVDSSAWDSRIYAISAASKTFLESIGAWRHVDPERVCAVSRMQVKGDRGASLTFSAYDSGLAALAWIVESGVMSRAIWACLERQGNLEVCRPAVPTALSTSSSAASLDLDDGRSVQTRLVVGADGAQSFVRSAAGIAVDVKPYLQSGVVANFRCRKAHLGTAYQWFREDGILAWLPLPGDRMSMVWSTSEAHVAELLALPEAELCERVAEAGGRALGDLELITPAAAFPLALRKAEHMIGHRVALVGDAAHTVHPLAGHGVNLGFGDAAKLAETLCGARTGADPGERGLLRRFERARAEDIMLMRATTDGLQKLFGVRAAPVSWLRNAGMGLVDRTPMVKNLLTRHASGAT
jgi:2-octaprenylphenol hydroxylase